MIGRTNERPVSGASAIAANGSNVGETSIRSFPERMSIEILGNPLPNILQGFDRPPLSVPR